jgi:iron complex outermembrane receptor protein
LSTSHAIFGQATFALTDDIHVTGGYRRTTDYRRTDTTAGPVYFKEFHGFQIPLSVAGTKPLPGAGSSRSEVPKASANTYTVAVDWKFADDWLTYATTRTGYKGGGINGNTPEDDPARFFGPEHVTDYEVGLKGDFEILGTRIRNNIAAYQTDYKDIQRTSILPGTAQTVTQNLAQATIRGIEVELNVQPSQYFDVNGYFAYTDGKFDEWLENTTCSSQPFQPVCTGQPATTPLIVDHAHGRATAAGSTSTFTPDLMAELSKYRYGIQPAVHLGFLSDRLETATLSANAYYRSASARNDTNHSVRVGPSNLLPGYTLVDARFDWRNISGGNLSLFASATNVQGKTFPVFIGDATNICNCMHAIYSEPRMWNVGFSYDFVGR